MSHLSPENTTGTRTVSVVQDMVFRMFRMSLEVSKNDEQFYYENGLVTERCKCAVITLIRL